LLHHHHHTTTVLRLFFRDNQGEPVPEEKFWTLWCKGRLTEADTPTIQLGATPSGLTSAHLYHPPYFLQAGCPSCRPTNSVKALTAAVSKGFIWEMIMGDFACAVARRENWLVEQWQVRKSVNDELYGEIKWNKC